MKLKTIMTSGVLCMPLIGLAGVPGHGIDRANLNEKIRPADDFYDYACGGWMEKNPLTPEYSRFGTFDILRENNRRQLQELIMQLRETPDAKVSGTIAQKVGDLYSLGMDSARLNAEGAQPIMQFVEKINATKHEDMPELIAWMHNGMASVLFSTGVAADQKNSDLNIMHIGEGGLGLGDRDYYLEDNETNQKIRTAYHDYIVKVMRLLGYDDEAAQRVWNNVWKIESHLAAHKKTREQRRNPQLGYNPRTIEELLGQYPNLTLDRYFKALGINNLQSANVASVAYLDELNNYLPTLTDQELKDYFTFHALNDATSLMSDDFADASFELYDRVMSGKEEPEPRWKRAMSVPNSMLGEAVGQLYVEKYFPEESKTYMRTLVENLRTALGRHIDNLPWMSPDTKAAAHDKLSRITVKIGYPDKWKDYSEITIDPSKSYLENVYNASVWYVQDNYKKLGQPVDKDQWLMTPQTVNAYYMPSTNEICFPAGILQYPYFDIAADDALNYGAIGVVIGHEMTHGFDDQGRQYDANGNLHDWWTADDASRFNALADRLAAQFDAIEVAPGVHANGRFTLGENIADQGGLRVALTAYLDSQKDKPAADIDSLSPLQRFYLAYALLWAGNIRDEEILSRTKTDPHSLGRWRVNATLRNIAPFYEAFSITDTDPMWLPTADRVIIW